MDHLWIYIWKAILCYKYVIIARTPFFCPVFYILFYGLKSLSRCFLIGTSQLPLGIFHNLKIIIIIIRRRSRMESTILFQISWSSMVDCRSCNSMPVSRLMVSGKVSLWRLLPSACSFQRMRDDIYYLISCTLTMACKLSHPLSD